MCVRNSSGQVVMQASADISVGGSNPGAVNVCSGAADQDSNRRPKMLRPSALPFDREGFF